MDIRMFFLQKKLGLFISRVRGQGGVPLFALARTTPAPWWRVPTVPRLGSGLALALALSAGQGQGGGYIKKPPCGGFLFDCFPIRSEASNTCNGGLCRLVSSLGLLPCDTWQPAPL
jgi:hypothetical protein